MASLRQSTLALLVVVLAVIAASCGEGDGGDGVAIADGSAGADDSTDDGSTGGGTGTDEAADDGSDEGGGAPIGDADTGGNEGSNTSTGDADQPGSGDTGLPGDPFDIGPPAGAELDVVGVRYDDVLNFRERPDPSAPIVDTAAPESTTPRVVSAGDGRLLTRSAWWRVTVGGEEAWANLRFLGMLGATDDVFDELADALPSTSAATVDELVEAIGESRASGPEPSVELVTPVEGLDADGAQVTIDVIGLGDDAVKGERILLTFDLTFDDPNASDREVVSYELVGASSTAICGRGLSGEACV